LGLWECTWGKNENGSNGVERILDGKAIQENCDGRKSQNLLNISHPATQNASYGAKGGLTITNHT